MPSKETQPLQSGYVQRMDTVRSLCCTVSGNGLRGRHTARSCLHREGVFPDGVTAEPPEGVPEPPLPLPPPQPRMRPVEMPSKSMRHARALRRQWATNGMTETTT
jgi:hypothetical protein